jgi:hypothetical protein
MRYLFLTLIFPLFSNALFAQMDSASAPTLSTQAEDFAELKKRINKSSDRLVMDFTYDMLLNTPDSVEFKGFSRGFNIYFMYDKVLGKSNFSIAGGLGLGTNNYFHNNTITSDTVATYFNRINTNLIDVKKAKIGLTYVDIPVEFRFRSNPNKKDKSWKLAAGFKAGFLIHNKWKYKGEDPTVLDGSGEQVKFKQFNIDYLNKLRYGVTLRGGYGMWNAFVYYSLSDLFEDGRGPRMTPLSFGISINGL